MIKTLYVHSAVMNIYVESKNTIPSPLLPLRLVDWREGINTNKTNNSHTLAIHIRKGMRH